MTDAPATIRYGVVFPQTEIGDEREVIADYATTAAGLGFDHVIAFDHVVGADRSTRPGWSSPYDASSQIFEPLTLFAYLAALTPLELVTGVLVLPQRQTVLVAKQAATIDVLSGGRLRLGVGLGWNDVEYRALGRPFANRGHTLETQIKLIRDLCTESVVTGTGVFGEDVDRAGIAPLPVRRPIPIWIGTGADPRALARVGRLADGFIPRPELTSGTPVTEALTVVRRSAEAAGRDPDSLGVQAIIRVGDVGGFDAVPREIEIWRSHGATHVAFYTTRLGLRGREHIAAIERIAATLQIPPGSGK